MSITRSVHESLMMIVVRIADVIALAKRFFDYLARPELLVRSTALRRRGWWRSRP